MTNQNTNQETTRKFKAYDILGLPCSQIEFDFFNNQRAKGVSRALALRMILQSREDIKTFGEAPTNPLINLF